MKLQQLLERMEYQLIQGTTDVEIARLCYDNRQVQAGDLFVCISGARFDTHDCLQDIADKGATAIMIEKPLSECGALSTDIPVLQVASTRQAEASLAAAYYGHPADHLTMIGITGSKGKTTTTHMLADILRQDGRKVGTVGTNGAIIGDKVIELANTTPSAQDMQMYLAKMVEEGMDTAVIECSSQGLMQYRTGGMTFDCGVFLNISTGDHIGPNEHKDFAEYLHCKGMLLQQSRLGFVNADDAWTETMLKEIDTPIVRFGTSEGVDYRLSNIRKTFEHQTPGLLFDVDGAFHATLPVNLPGEFNAANALAAVAVAHHLGASKEAMERALSHMKIKGRFDIVFRNEHFAVCVDFAHNGYSTRNHLEALREYHPKRLVCVFGADGNRSKSRRYEMGEASGRLADFSIVTAGHNRWESFEDILKDIHVGLDKTDGAYMVIPNRKDAVRYAIENAEDVDFITILGLGHESYQEENGVKYPYSDREYVLQVVKELGLQSSEQ